jgi:HSP20 family protein
MSPFCHHGFHSGFGTGIYHDFSPVLHYIHDLDRYFSHDHRLTSSFVPRFDLEEDEMFYYLIGDIPGGRAEDITIEPNDDHTLIIHGVTGCFGFSLEPLIGRKSQHNSNELVSVPDQKRKAAGIHSTYNNYKPPAPIPLPPQGHIRRGTTSYIGDTDRPKERSKKKVLLSERLVGDFRRTFTFPAPIVEEKVQATIKNGVLRLKIPKREKSTVEKLRKIPVAEEN